MSETISCDNCNINATSKCGQSKKIECRGFNDEVDFRDVIVSVSNIPNFNPKKEHFFDWEAIPKPDYISSLDNPAAIIKVWFEDKDKPESERREIEYRIINVEGI